jgi:hypothetical protein
MSNRENIAILTCNTVFHREKKTLVMSKMNVWQYSRNHECLLSLCLAINTLSFPFNPKVGLLSATITKYTRQPILKSESFILLRILEVSVMESGPRCFGACGKAAHHGRRCVVEQSCSSYGSQEAKRERTWSPNIPLRDTPPSDLTSFH